MSVGSYWHITPIIIKQLFLICMDFEERIDFFLSHLFPRDSAYHSEVIVMISG